jgi:hypothetical protein
MYLKPKQCERFYKIFDALIAYALELMPESHDLLDPETLQINPASYNAVAQKLWASPDIIESFVSTNPSRLSFDDLKVVLDWKHAVHGRFLLYDHTLEFSTFVLNGVAFGVTGLSQELIEIIDEVPTLVETTLLPFEGRVVYAVTISSYPIAYGLGMQDLFYRWYQVAMGEGFIITDALNFIQASKKIKEDLQNQEIDDQVDNYLKEKNPLPEDGDGFKGMHRGILAGLTPRQRKKAVEAEINKDNPFNTHYREWIKSEAKATNPSISIAEILSALTKNQILDFGDDALLESLTKYNKTDLIKHISESKNLSNAVNQFLDYCSDFQFKTFNSLVKLGGRYTVKASLSIDDLRSDQKSNKLNLIGVQQAPYINLYFHDGSFTLTIPDELLAAYQKVNIQKIRRSRKQKSQIANLANTITDLCGIITPDDLLPIYQELHGPIDADLFTVLATELAYSEQSEYETWTDSEQKPYLMYFTLYDDLYDSIYSGDRDQAKDAIGFVEYLIERHEQVPIKQLDFKKFDSHLAFYEYKLQIPEVVKLLQFFDAHVPDQQNDYYFAEKMLELILNYMNWEPNPNLYLEILGDEGLEFDNLDKINELLTLISNALNHLPHWVNNGWTPAELHNQQFD